ncbi:hypothetical protein [Natrinema versiforme]|nr:hypothetical protein [Natrinema versiforme]
MTEPVASLILLSVEYVDAIATVDHDGGDVIVLEILQEARR